jgi:hypothetical protein
VLSRSFISTSAARGYTNVQCPWPASPERCAAPETFCTKNFKNLTSAMCTRQHLLTHQHLLIAPRRRGSQQLLTSVSRLLHFSFCFLRVTVVMPQPKTLAMKKKAQQHASNIDKRGMVPTTRVSGRGEGEFKKRKTRERLLCFIGLVDKG